MRRSFWLSAAAVSFVACASPAPFGAVKAASHNCTDLFAGAMATRHEVKGSWACLSPDIQDQFRSVGLEGDSGIAQLAAKDPVYSQERYLGRLSDGGYVYSLSGSAGASVLLVWLDQSGRITDIQSGGRAQRR